jgi:signal transduction histidine kinase
VVKGQEQELDLTLTRWDLHAACREWIDEMQHTEQKHRILFDAPEQPCPVCADYSLIRRVAVSLISNAVKYDGHHSDIHVRLESLGQDVILKVTDQGIGIPPEDLPYIFDSFYRSANVGAVHGTGMGLTIVRDSVQRHGGQIDVTSQEGRGTQFTVRLPIAVR